MRSGQALAQHLQVLQSGRPLDAPWHDAPIGAVGLLQPSREELFTGIEAADAKRLQEVVRTAEFWIALLEGERTDLAEEVVKHKQRHQLALRQVDTQAKALREAELEKKRLEKENKWLQQSRDEAVAERDRSREDAKNVQQSQTTRTEQDFDVLSTQARSLEEELQHERQEKDSLEEKLVLTKVRHVEALQRADSMEVLISYYEDQLKALDPQFERKDLSTLGMWLPSRTTDESEVESNASMSEQAPETPAADEESGARKKKRGLKSKIGRFWRKLKEDHETREASPRHSDTPAVDDEDDSPTPREGDGPPKRWMLRSED